MQEQLILMNHDIFYRCLKGDFNLPGFLTFNYCIAIYFRGGFIFAICSDREFNDLWNLLECKEHVYGRHPTTNS